MRGSNRFTVGREAAGGDALAASLVSAQVIRPDELQLIEDLQAGGVAAVTYRLGLTRQGARKRVLALAARLDAGGYNGQALRLMASQRRPRTRVLTGLRGPELDDVTRWAGAVELSPPASTYKQRCRSWSAIRRKVDA